MNQELRIMNKFQIQNHKLHHIQSLGCSKYPVEQ